MRGSSTRSELAVPLKVAGRVIGVLDAQSERLNAFDESDLTVMQSLASQAAIAIENARLYERMGRQVAQLTALQETNRAVTGTLERNALLKLITEQATTLLQADGGLINLVDWEGQEDEKEVGQGGFDQSDLDLLVAFADQAAIAIENARLYEEAQQLAATQERSRLARDLHDAVTQTLFSASLIAEVLPALWESDHAEGRQLLGELRHLTRGALAEMRTLLLELRPAALVEANLGDLLRQLAESVSGRSGIPVIVSLEGCPVPDLPDDVHVALYRIAQEALNNVVKHAQATRVAVTLRCERTTDDRRPMTDERRRTTDDRRPMTDDGRSGAAVRVELQISDDGRGFDPTAVAADHLGLGIIRERSQVIAAHLVIASQPDQGTQVTVIWDSAPAR
jgi:signal transduction histidine kinase